jgi:hypothetical protein
MQTKWAAILNVLLQNQSLASSILSNVPLINGTTVINHKLNRKLQGYRIILKNAAANIYDKQATNQTPDKTLIFVSDAAVTVSIEVF